MSGQLDFRDLQEIQRGLIAANPFFDGISVLVDDGDKNREHEAALKEKGVSILVLPVTDGVLSSQAGRHLSFDFLNAVLLSINTIRNASPEGAQINIFDAPWEILKSVMSYKRQPGEPFWSPRTGRSWQMVTYNPGLWETELHFVRNLLIA